jgi:hypothetical protein
MYASEPAASNKLVLNACIFCGLSDPELKSKSSLDSSLTKMLEKTLARWARAFRQAKRGLNRHHPAEFWADHAGYWEGVKDDL